MRIGPSMTLLCADLFGLLKMGQDAHVLTFPVDHGKTLNIVVFKIAADDWADKSKLTKSRTQSELMIDFAGFGESVKKLLSLTGKTLDIV